MKILLACNAGASTSLLEKKMNDYSKANNLDIQTKAFSAGEAKQVFKEYDVILIGPQIRYMKGDFEKFAEGKPIDVIPPNIYAMAKADEVIKLANSILEKK